jgi:hypothetical protein
LNVGPNPTVPPKLRVPELKQVDWPAPRWKIVGGFPLDVCEYACQEVGSWLT